jgi:hypothetical protein
MSRWLSLAVFLLPLPALASVAEVFGIGSAVGKAGAVVATTDAGSSAFYNPGGLGFRPAPQLQVGFEALHSELRLKGERVDIARPFGVLVDAASPVPLRGVLAGRLAIGAALLLNPQSHLVVMAPAKAEPTLPYYENRTQRVLALVGVGARLLPNLSVGVGANYFAGVRGRVRGSEGAAGDLQADLQEEFYGHATLNAGAQARFDGLAFGLSYRSQFSVPVLTTSDISVADSLFSMSIAADALFCPETWTFGTAYDMGGLGAGVELSWRRWSRYRSPFPQIDASVPRLGLGEDGQQVVTGADFEPSTRDIWRAAAFGEVQLVDGLHLSLGYAFEPSPFRLDRGPMNLIDGPKQIVALGMRWRTQAEAALVWGADLGAQAQWMGYQRLVKDPSRLVDEDPSTPGRQTSNLGYPSIAGGGLTLAAAVSLVLEWQAEAPGTTEVRR